MQARKLSCVRLLKSKNCDSDDGINGKFSVKYLGQGELERPGLEDMCEFVHSVSVDGRKSKQKDILKGDFILSNENCSIKPTVRESLESPLVFRTRRIQFCGVYEVNPKIFFFTYQFGKTADVVQCHVLKCKSKKEAKRLAKEAGLLFKDLAFSLNRRVRDSSKNYRTKLSSLDSDTSNMSTS